MTESKLRGSVSACCPSLLSRSPRPPQCYLCCILARTERNLRLSNLRATGAAIACSNLDGTGGQTCSGRADAEELVCPARRRRGDVRRREAQKLQGGARGNLAAHRFPADMLRTLGRGSQEAGPRGKALHVIYCRAQREATRRQRSRAGAATGGRAGAALDGARINRYDAARVAELFACVQFYPTRAQNGRGCGARLGCT